jgi:hypothetical protein
MFLERVEEKEILDIVKNCKNKQSTDLNDIDMSLVKLVIEGISKPLTHICNLSFQTGSFPNQMKIAKVIPLYKMGANTSSQTTDLSHYCLNFQKYWRNYLIAD